MPNVETTRKELTDFVAGRKMPTGFSHREHLRLAFAMLERHPFGETLELFALGLKRMTANAGQPLAYHQTRTVAFLALVAERRLRQPGTSWEEFIAANADLAEKHCLEFWYEAEELDSDLARRTFILPRRAIRERVIPTAGAAEI